MRAPMSEGQGMANRLRARGEGGSRSLITRPRVRRATGSTRSIARVPRGHSEKPQEMARHDGRPLSGGDMRDEVEDRIRLHGRDRLRADRAKDAVDDAAVLHVGRQQAERHRCRLAPTSPASRPANAPSSGVSNAYSSAQIGFGSDPFDRLGVQIGQSDVEFEGLDSPLDLAAGHREDRDGDARVLDVERSGELRDYRQRGRNRAQSKLPGETLAELLKATTHG